MCARFRGKGGRSTKMTIPVAQQIGSESSFFMLILPQIDSNKLNEIVVFDIIS